MRLRSLLVLAVAAGVTVSAAWTVTIDGTARRDLLRGGPRADLLRGKGNHDRLYGYAGRDRLEGGMGNDLLVGGKGSDRLYGGPGNDSLEARDGRRDVVRCGRGHDTGRADPVDSVALDCEGVTSGTPAAPRPETVINTTEPWDCDRPLASYGELPIMVVQEIDNSSPAGRADGIGLEGGCTGDGTAGTIDLIIDQRGNGGTVGPGGDAVKLRRGSAGSGPENIDITGTINCGSWRWGHQDGVHAMTGSGIRFWKLVSGNPTTRHGTCWGAGGLLFIARGADNFPMPTHIVCYECRLVSASPERGDGSGGTGLRISTSVRSGARKSCFYNGRLGIVVVDRENPVEPVTAGSRWVRTGQLDRCS